jgi:signal transduction histidine kinase
MLNLVMNGVEAMSTVDGARNLTISSKSCPGEGIHISVEDTGAGVDPANAKRVFDLFFTTKAAGMGMGLSICRSIIGAHDGRIWLEPKEPQGATFRFKLPVGGETASTSVTS